jgi:hypothetical protein
VRLNGICVHSSKRDFIHSQCSRPPQQKGTWFLFDVVFYGNTLFEPFVLETAFGSHSANSDGYELLQTAVRDSLVWRIRELRHWSREDNNVRQTYMTSWSIVRRMTKTVRILWCLRMKCVILVQQWMQNHHRCAPIVQVTVYIFYINAIANACFLINLV